MSWARVIAARLRGLAGHKRLERELDAEIRFHLDSQIEENLKAGMNPEEARYAAMRSFGAVEAMKEEYRERRALALVETAIQDIRYAFRTLRHSAGFSASSVATLALAIGANTAIFSVVNSVLLRPLPYRSPEQLAMLWTGIPSQNLRHARAGYWNVEMWRESRSFADMAAFDGVSLTLTTSDRADQIAAVRISPNFLSVLGVEPLRGRMFSAQEAEQRQRVALISYRFWQQRFGASPDAIGASIELNGIPSRVLGILPASFRFPKVDADVWEPHTLFPDWNARRAVRGADTWSVVGRLRPNVSFTQAQAEMSAIARRLDEQMPANERNRGISVVPLSLHVVDPKSRFALWMLAAAVFCVLLIAAFNVTSLSLARGISRARELAIRTALGATRTRVVRLLLAEGVTLAAISGAAGSLLALAGIRVLRSLDPFDVGLPAGWSQISIDLRVLAAAVALSVCTGLLIGLAPAVTMFRNLRPSVEEGGRNVSSGVAAHGLRRALITAEFALAIMLLAGAGLLLRSWRYLQNVDSGFRPERVLTMGVRTPVRMGAGQRVNFYNEILEQIESMPGVETAGLTSDLFISSTQDQVLTPESGTRSNRERVQLRRDEVSANFFKAAGTPLLSGRFFSIQDGPDSPRVAIINHSLARRLWPESDPVGRRFQTGAADSANPWFTVVGVVGDMRRQGLEREPIPQMFESLSQKPSGGGLLVVRTNTDDPLKLAPAIEAAVRRVEKHALISGTATLESRLAASLAPRRFQTSLVAGFSAIALLMAAIGIYGLIQYSIATRTREIGIRMAVGACAGDIFRMVVGEGLKLSLAGLAIGLVGALLVSQAASKLLFGVTPRDPLTFFTASLLLTVVAAAACYFPARRATKVEPVHALREQ